MTKMTKSGRESLSADARYCGASLFRMMEPGKGVIRFLMIDSEPSPRTQAALDELVAAGLVSSTPFNRFGGVEYRPLVEFPRAKSPSGDWPITVPLTDARRKARAALKETENE